jgi:hypothetical protein
MKTLFILLLVSISISTRVFGNPILFDNNYEGVRPGKSTLQDVQHLLGKPLRVIPTPNGHNYRYEKAIINISGYDLLHVNTIIIDNDFSYKCPNGFKIGDTIANTKKETGTCTFFDNKNGVIYWLNDKKIVKIVLLSQDQG